MYTGVEDPAGGHCWADRPQHLARWAGSDDLEGMAVVGNDLEHIYSSGLLGLQITET